MNPANPIMRRKAMSRAMLGILILVILAVVAGIVLFGGLGAVSAVVPDAAFALFAHLPKVYGAVLGLPC